MEKNQGLVSIIMPTYNCAKFIAESIDSVIAQTYTNWGLIIVDDCSTNNTKEILTPYLQKYKNMHYTCLTKKGGPVVARTEVLKRAKGDYVDFLDSDDSWYSQKLEKQLIFMQAIRQMFNEQIDEADRPLKRVLKSVKKTLCNRLLLVCLVVKSKVIYDVEKMSKITYYRLDCIAFIKYLIVSSRLRRLL